MKKITLIYCQDLLYCRAVVQLLVDYFDPRFKYRFISLEENVKLSPLYQDAVEGFETHLSRHVGASNTDRPSKKSRLI